MQTSMGQTATTLNGLLEDIYGDTMDGGSEEMIEAQLLQARKELIEAVRTSSDYSAPVNKLVQLKCPITLKYSQLNVRDLLKDNNESVAQLKAIPVALTMLEKYGRHLLKPPGARVDQWRQIKFNNPIFKDRVLPVHGALEVIQQLGYSEAADFGLQFAQDEPDVEATCNLVADIILARTEMERYLTNKHPHPDIVHSYMPESTTDQLEAHWDQLANVVNINPPAAASLAPQQYFHSPTPVSAPIEMETETGAPIQTTESQPVDSGDLSDPSLSSSHQLDDSLHKACDICGETAATLWCRTCDNKQLCNACDDMWHRHPKRQNHERDTMASLPSPSAAQTDNIMGPFGIRAVDSMSSQQLRRHDVEKSPTPVSGGSGGGAAAAGYSNLSRTPPPQQSHTPPPPSHLLQESQQQAPLDSPQARLQQHQQLLQHYQQLQQQDQFQQQRDQFQQQQQQIQQQQFQNFGGDYHTLQSGHPPHAPSDGGMMNQVVMGSLPAHIHRAQEGYAPVSSAGYPPSSAHPAGYPYDSDPMSQSMYTQSSVGQQRATHIPQPDYSLRTPHTGGSVAAGYGDTSLRQPHRAASVGVPVTESSVFSTMPRRSFSSSSAQSLMSESVLLKGILEESDYEKRAAKCDVRLLTLDEELQEVEGRLNDLLLNDPDCTESDDFKKLTRNKARLMKESKALSNYKMELAELMAVEAPRTPRSSGDVTTPIYHPPSVSSSESLYGSYPSSQMSTPYPTVPSPNQIASTVSYPSPTHTQYGFSYPHQVSNSPGQEAPPMPANQMLANRNSYPKPPQSHISYYSPNAQESMVASTPVGPNASVDQSSILPQWQMNPGMALVAPQRPNVSQSPPYPPPRYQDGNYNNNAVSYASPGSYGGVHAARFSTAGMSAPVAQEHGMPVPAHLGESHSTGDMIPSSHGSGLSRPNSAPAFPGQGNASQGQYNIGFDDLLLEEEQQQQPLLIPFQQQQQYLPQFGAGNIIIPPPASAVSRPTPSLTPSPPPVRRSSPVGQSASRFSAHGQRWQCSHCTYVNGAGTRVCVMCDRTSDSPTLIGHVEEVYGEAVLSQYVKEAPQPQEARKAPVGAAAEAEKQPSISKAQLDKVNQRIAEEQDQVYLEKKEAHEQYYRQQGMKQTANQGQGQSQNQGTPALSSHPPSITPPPLPPDVATPAPCPPVPPRKRPASQAAVSQGEDTSELAETQVSGQPVVIKGVAGGVPADGGVGGGQDNKFGSSVDPPLSFIAEGDFHTTMERYSEQKRMKEQQINGAKLLHFIKMADRQGFVFEEMQVALIKCQNNYKESLNFLSNEWEKLIQVVVASTRADGQKSEHNDIGDLSPQEARQALMDSKGDMAVAVKACVAKRKQLYAALNPDGTFAREEVLQAMLQGCGEEDIARDVLHTAVLQPFLHRVWQEGERGEGTEILLRQMQMPESTYPSVSTSVITHPDFQQTIADISVERDRRIRMILVEGKLKSWGRAEMVIKLLDQDLPSHYPGARLGSADSPYTLEDVIEAVRNCNDRNSARAYLTQECSTCFCLYPMSKIRSLNFCQCKICSDCLKQNFDVVIREKHVRHWTCPMCNMPDFQDAETAEEYLNFLGMLLKHQVDREVYELFDTKVRDWRLQKDPNFRWCAHCASGFLGDERQLRMTCPHCNDQTCFRCKKMWEDQHEGLTCDQFAQWKIDNDPNNQAVGLARHLEENGIDCPGCNMRYALAKGGCMHFKCPQCGHEFCSGCYQPFYQKGACSRLQSCKTSGLHAHHPRDCFFYLRDDDIDHLQSLLRDNNVQFNTTTPENQEDAQHCPVIEQKEFDSGKRDESCGKDTQDGHAGLCPVHYKEYLVGLINKNNIDPVVAMTLDDLKKLLLRAELQLPKISKNETEANYRKRIIKFVKDKIRLPRRDPC